MPVFEYKCTSCGKHREALQKYEDKPLKVCQYCNGETLIKLFGAPAFTLVGNGYFKPGTH